MREYYDRVRMLEALKAAGIALSSTDYGDIIHAFNLFIIPPAWQIAEDSKEIAINLYSNKWRIKPCRS